MVSPETDHPIVPANARVAKEAEGLSGEIVEAASTASTPLSAIELKALRLAQILNDSPVQQTFVRRSAGDISTESTEESGNTIAKGKTVLRGALELPGPYGGKWALQDMDRATRELASRRIFMSDYAIRKHYEVRFSSLAEDAFGRILSGIDSSIGDRCPTQ